MKLSTTCLTLENQGKKICWIKCKDSNLLTFLRILTAFLKGKPTYISNPTWKVWPHPLIMTRWVKKPLWLGSGLPELEEDKSKERHCRQSDEMLVWLCSFNCPNDDTVKILFVSRHIWAIPCAWISLFSDIIGPYLALQLPALMLCVRS